MRRSSIWINIARTIAWAAVGAIAPASDSLPAAEPAIIHAARVIEAGDGKRTPAVVTGVSITPDAR
ncbi:MAG TPA: hypothetical protein VJ828_08360, partial [Lacipirellulaceae bacterium]|nr:hypothetical protein [Lacipirellulaceae bacterium]